MNNEKMDVYEAAKALHGHLLCHDWLVCVGANTTDEAVVIYTTSERMTRQAFSRSEWHGYKVMVSKCGKPRLA